MSKLDPKELSDALLLRIEKYCDVREQDAMTLDNAAAILNAVAMTHAMLLCSLMTPESDGASLEAFRDYIAGMRAAEFRAARVPEGGLPS